MSQLVTKIHCPNPKHEDLTESCAVYSDGHAYCFGCNSHFATIDGVAIPKEPLIQTEPENIKEKIEYIESLPVREIRGLMLPYDNKGYYIVWPDKDYYKLRLWDSPNLKGRYVSPKGHAYTPLIPNPYYFISPSPVVVIEGEFNALSYYKAFPEDMVLSFGSASELGSGVGHLSCEDWEIPGDIVVFVDNDPAGVAGALKFKASVKEYCPNVRIYTLDKDFNDLLVQGGVDAIKEKVKQLGV